MVYNMKELTKSQSLRFNGSLWCNLDIALRNLDQIYTQAVQSMGLSVIEWYILRSLLDQDGQHASELAKAVGRAATSFTPILDKLQKKNMIERRADPTDRRAVRIFLTNDGRKQKSAINKTSEQIDAQLRELFPNGEYEAFQQSLALLQSLEQN
jgi:DNA-binding MarR family transcriptional regulator